MVTLDSLRADTVTELKVVLSSTVDLAGADE